MTMRDLEGHALPSNSLPGLTDADRAWVTGLDPGTMTSMEAGRLRAMAYRAEPGDKPACLARLAAWEEEHPRPGSTVNPGAAEAMAAGRSRGQAAREAREAAEAKRRTLPPGLQTMEQQFGPTQEAGR